MFTDVVLVYGCWALLASAVVAVVRAPSCRDVAVTEEVEGIVLAMAVVAMRVEVTGAADLRICATAATEVTAEVAGEENGTEEA